METLDCATEAFKARSQKSIRIGLCKGMGSTSSEYRNPLRIQTTPLPAARTNERTAFNARTTMNKRTVLIILTWALCLGTGWAVLFQRRELIRLRAQQEQAPARAVAAQTEMHDDKASVNADALS